MLLRHTKTSRHMEKRLLWRILQTNGESSLFSQRFLFSPMTMSCWVLHLYQYKLGKFPASSFEKKKVSQLSTTVLHRFMKISHYRNKQSFTGSPEMQSLPKTANWSWDYILSTGGSDQFTTKLSKEMLRSMLLQASIKCQITMTFEPVAQSRTLNPPPELCATKFSHSSLFEFVNLSKCNRKSIQRNWTHVGGYIQPI